MKAARPVRRSGIGETTQGNLDTAPRADSYWQHGGSTDVGNLVMLCCAHHDQIHTTEWHIDMSTGIPRFIPPDWLAELKAAA